MRSSTRCVAATRRSPARSSPTTARCTSSSTSTSTTTTSATSAKLDTKVGDGRHRLDHPGGRRRRLMALVRQRPRPDRQHADGRHLAAQPEPAGADPGQARGPEPRRLGQGPGRQVDDRGGGEGRLARARARRSSSRRRATPGIALAMIAKVKGYPFKVVLPDNVSIERRQLLEVWGAEIIPSDAAGRVQRRHAPGPGAGGRAPGVVVPLPVRQPRQPQGPLRGTGPEIWRDCPEITHFVAGLGTAGTLMGVGRFLKERNPDGPDVGRRAAGGGDGGRPEEPRRGVHPAGVHRVRRLRPARPQEGRRARGSRSSGPGA